MVILISDVAEHFNCSNSLAAKITNILAKATDVNISIKGVIDFKFCGVMYSLTRHEGEWIMVRSTITRSTNFDDVL